MSRLGNYYVSACSRPHEEPLILGITPTLMRAKAAVIAAAHRQVDWVDPTVTDPRGPLTWRAQDGASEYRIALVTLQGQHIPRSAPADILPQDLMNALTI